MYARTSDRRAGRPVYFPIRYADDFVILVSGDEQTAHAEKSALAHYLRETLKLELSLNKTRITSLTDGFEFLGHRIRLRWDPRFGYTPRVEIPKAKILDFRYRVKQLTGRQHLYLSLSEQLQVLNPILRGWGNFYRHCTNAKNIFASLDWYVGDRLWRWMRNKYPRANAHAIAQHRRPTVDVRSRRRVWADNGYEQYIISRIPVCRYQRGWMGTADYAKSLGEPDA